MFEDMSFEFGGKAQKFFKKFNIKEDRKKQTSASVFVTDTNTDSHTHKHKHRQTDTGQTELRTDRTTKKQKNEVFRLFMFQLLVCDVYVCSVGKRK